MRTSVTAPIASVDPGVILILHTEAVSDIDVLHVAGRFFDTIMVENTESYD